MTNGDIKWAAQVSHVREVTLLGTADLAYWAARLSREDLIPDERGEKARVMIVGAALKWMGVRFRELSVSVLVRAAASGAERKGTYLLHAWSSSRFFAACERVFFSTPYTGGGVRVSASGPGSVRLMRGGEIAFRAEMRADGAGGGGGPSLNTEGGWSGPVYLPGNAAAATGGGGGKLFFARATGLTEMRPFCPERDLLTIRPGREDGALAALVESRFVATEWAVRPDATHAKSKTYRRDAAPW